MWGNACVTLLFKWSECFLRRLSRERLNLENISSRPRPHAEKQQLVPATSHLSWAQLSAFETQVQYVHLFLLTKIVLGRLVSDKLVVATISTWSSTQLDRDLLTPFHDSPAGCAQRSVQSQLDARFSAPLSTEGHSLAPISCSPCASTTSVLKLLCRKVLVHIAHTRTPVFQWPTHPALDTDVHGTERDANLHEFLGCKSQSERVRWVSASRHPLITALQLVTGAGTLESKAVPNEKLTNMDSMNVHVRSYNTAQRSLIIYSNIPMGIR